MKTLFIHPQDPSTDFLKPIYARIKDRTVITGGMLKTEIQELIKSHDRILCLGHGSPDGLLSVGQFPDSGSYIVDDTMVELLRNKTENLYIWCHAEYSGI